MTKYVVYATLTTRLATVVEADNENAAWDIVDQTYITDDFDEVGKVFRMTEVEEVKEEE